MENTSKTPAYLSFYLLRIRRHAFERDYFDKRFANMNLADMLIEVQMLQQLHGRGLIGLPAEKNRSKTFGERYADVAPGITCELAGTVDTVYYWSRFDLTPMGRYFIRESLFGFFTLSTWTFFVAALGALGALAVSKIAGA